MVQRKMMTNLEIYNIANILSTEFKEDLVLPVKVNFYFQKNMSAIVALAQDIDKSRMAIFQKYGTLNEEEQRYTFKPEDTDIVNQQLNDLFTLEQEVKVNLIELDWFGDVSLTTQQMAAINFMIKDEEEEDKDDE